MENGRSGGRNKHSYDMLTVLYVHYMSCTPPKAHMQNPVSSVSPHTVNSDCSE